MAIVTDPDLLSRYDVIFNTAAQRVSIYPVGDTQRNTATTYTNVFVDTVGTITPGGTENFNTDGVLIGDVVAIQNDVNGGHYYVRVTPTAGANNPASLALIDTGTGGAETTSLTVQTSAAFDGTSAVDDAAETVTISTHGYVTGDAIVYDNGGGTTITGLTQYNVYYLNRIDANTVSLHSTYAAAVADTGRINMTDTGTSALNVFHNRLIVGIFNNGASTSEQINGFDTSGDGDGDVLDGITQQAIYSFGKEEWRVDSLVTDLTPEYNDNLIRHQFPYEAITSEQFEVGGGTAHDNWDWFNLYTRKKVRTAGWAEKTDVGTGDLARETGIITLGSLDADSQVYYQQTSVVTPKVDFTFLGPVNEALRVYTDASADNTPTDNFTTYLKLFVRKKGRTYAGSQISDIGVTTIQTIVNRFPLAHAVDTAITLTDAELLGTNPYKFATTPVAIASGTDGSKTITQATFTSAAVGDFAAAGVIAGDILRITEADADIGYYEITTVATTTLTVTEFESVAGNDFTFGTGWAATNAATDFEIYSTLLSPDNQTTGVLVESTATGLVDTSGVTGTLTDTGATFTAGRVVAAGDILIISQFYDISFNASTDVDVTTADTITAATHNLRTGDRVIYDINGGTVIAGLVDATVYYVAVETSGRFWLCATLANAWARANGDSTEIALTPGASEPHLLHVHEGDGAYDIITPGVTTLVVDTTDYQFPTTSKAIGTTYHVVEAGMYLQYKNKTVQSMNDTQTTTPITDLDFTGLNTITIVGGPAIGFDYLDDTGATVAVQSGDMLVITGSTANDGRYTVLSRTNAQELVIFETFAANTANDQAGVTLEIIQGFERTIGPDDLAFNWKVTGNGGTLQNVFQFIQSELRSSADIDQGAGTFVPAGNTGLVGFIGNINDLLMSFASPTGSGLNLFIDDLDSNDINNATFFDHAGNAQNFPFTSSGSLVFNPNLTNDQNSKYWLFFTNDDAGDNLGRDYGTENAIIVEDATTPTANPITGFVNASGGATHGGTRTVDSGTTSISFTYAYDTNVQRGTGSVATTAPVTLVAIGAPTAQFVIAAGNITNATGITISAVAALERNYNGTNPG